MLACTRPSSQEHVGRLRASTPATHGKRTAGTKARQKGEWTQGNRGMAKEQRGRRGEARGSTHPHCDDDHSHNRDERRVANGNVTHDGKDRCHTEERREDQGTEDAAQEGLDRRIELPRAAAHLGCGTRYMVQSRAPRAAVHLGTGYMVQSRGPKNGSSPRYMVYGTGYRVEI